MKFDHIIMNPPYCRNLHLKILNEALKHSDDIVKLSPIRWLQDPLAEYKRKSDFNKVVDISNKIESLDVIKATDAERFFNVGLPFNLGVYHITNTGGWVSTFENKLLCKIVDKIILVDSLMNHIVIDDLDGISCLLSMMTGGQNGRLEAETPFMMKKEKCYFNNKKNIYTGKTYLEQRTESAWGNVKPKSENTNVKFNSEKERDNFYDSWNTKCLRWLFNKQKVDVNVHPQFLPWLGDYTHEWTDKDLYEYFNLTPEEIQAIENEFKDEI